MSDWIVVKTKVLVPIEKAYEVYTNPQHVKLWNHASEDWHTPKATNDLNEGGKFSYTMAAKDGSVSFDFSGTFVKLQPPNYIEILLDDGRGLELSFSQDQEGTLIEERFQAESLNDKELQRQGWQAILDNLKAYAENL